MKSIPLKENSRRDDVINIGSLLPILEVFFSYTTLWIFVKCNLSARKGQKIENFRGEMKAKQ